jgi:hypothetical protein
MLSMKLSLLASPRLMLLVVYGPVLGTNVLALFEGREVVLAVFTPDFVAFTRSLRDFAVRQFDKAVPQRDEGFLRLGRCGFLEFNDFSFIRRNVNSADETVPPSVSFDFEAVATWAFRTLLSVGVFRFVSRNDV